MIVWCCGMSRSGGTVQYQITKSLVERAGLGHGVGLKWQAYVPPEDPPKRWVVIKREQCTPSRMLNRASDERHSKVVGIYRDPRAVAASLLRWRTRQGRSPTLDDTLDETALALRWYRGWEPHLNYEVAYEEAVVDWGAVAIGINDALELGLSPEECREATHDWTPQKNLERMRKQTQWMDRNSLLTQVHITGAGDRWPDVLPVSLLHRVEQHCGEWMEAHGYDRVLDSAPAQIRRRGQILGLEPGEI